MKVIYEDPEQRFTLTELSTGTKQIDLYHIESDIFGNPYWRYCGTMPNDFQSAFLAVVGKLETKNESGAV